MSLEGVSAGYGRGRHVLHDINLDVPSGQFVGLAGPNGSGKTTLLHCITGYHRASRGKLLLAGHEVSALNRKQVAERVAFVPQKTETVFSYTVLQMVLMGRHPYSGFSAWDSAADVDFAAGALKRLNIAELANRLYDELSGGEKQMILLARAFAQRAPLLILDEPLTGLDLKHQHELMSAVKKLSREKGQGALATFHDLSAAARWCDRLILLHKGHVIADGSPSEVITPENLKAAYGVVAQVQTGYDGFSVFVSVEDCASDDSA